MKWILWVLCVPVLLSSASAYRLGSSAMHEIYAAVLLGTSALLFAAGCVVHAINQLRNEVRVPQVTVDRSYPPA